MIMTNEQSIKIIRELLVAVDNGGVLYSEKEREELKAALNAAIESLGAEYVLIDGKIYPLPKNPFPNAQSVTIPPIKLGKWMPICDRNGTPLEVLSDCFKCSECNETVEITEYSSKGESYNFCPFCGAKMEDNE